MGVLTPDAPDELYPTNGDDPSIFAAFDTDVTVDYARGPVPLSHVEHLRDVDHVSVWSTGFNQTLRDNAQIPGMRELKRKRDIPQGSHIERADRMRLLQRVYPDADEYIVVDDVDLRELEDEGWQYFHPYEYVTERLNFDTDDWWERVGLDPAEYLSGIGRLRGQMGPNALHTDADNPREARLADSTGGVK